MSKQAKPGKLAQFYKNIFKNDPYFKYMTGKDFNMLLEALDTCDDKFFKVLTSEKANKWIREKKTQNMLERNRIRKTRAKSTRTSPTKKFPKAQMVRKGRSPEMQPHYERLQKTSQGGPYGRKTHNTTYHQPMRRRVEPQQYYSREIPYGTNTVNVGQLRRTGRIPQSHMGRVVYVRRSPEPMYMTQSMRVPQGAYMNRTFQEFPERSMYMPTMPSTSTRAFYASPPIQKNVVHTPQVRSAYVRKTPETLKRGIPLEGPYRTYTSQNIKPKGQRTLQRSFVGQPGTDTYHKKRIHLKQSSYGTHGGQGIYHKGGKRHQGKRKEDGERRPDNYPMTKDIQIEPTEEQKKQIEEEEAKRKAEEEKSKRKDEKEEEEEEDAKETTEKKTETKKGKVSKKTEETNEEEEVEEEEIPKQKGKKGN